MLGPLRTSNAEGQMHKGHFHETFESVGGTIRNTKTCQRLPSEPSYSESLASLIPSLP